jgi:hypothetical protein
MADPRPEPRVEEVSPDAAQQNVGRDNMAGSGEWPSPSTPPRTDQGAPAGSTPDRHPSDEDAGFKEADEADPVLGGSGGAPREDGATEPEG